MSKHRDRGERRYQTWRYSQRVRRIEHFVYHRSRRRNCDCPDSVGRLRKAKAFGCRCLSKRKGAPKVAGSAHKSEHKYRTTVMRRIWNKRLARAWQDAVGANDFEDINLPAGAILGRRRHIRMW